VDVETWVSWHAIGEKPTLWHVADGDVTLCGRPIMARIPTRRSAPAVPDRCGVSGARRSRRRSSDARRGARATVSLRGACAGGGSIAEQQMRWALRYIKERYGGVKRPWLSFTTRERQGMGKGIEMGAPE
jgi:hypothetical protein